MKRIAIFVAASIMAIATQAQTLNVEVGNVTYAVPAEQAGDMVYTDGSSLTILGKTFAIGEIGRMYVDASTVKDNTVTVSFDGASAKVVVAGNVAQYVDAVVDGSRVSIAQSDKVGDDTCGEISYNLSGSSTDGAFYMSGSYKATVELNGLALYNSAGAPIEIQNSKRVDFSVKKGTVNTLEDCAGGSQKGCVVCKGHLEIKGSGELTVTANTSHAIYAKEYIEMKNCTINILKSVKDGINCNQYFLLESGTLNIAGVGDDAIQVSFKDDADREEEDTGCITIAGGKLSAATTATASKCLKADADVIITGGELELSTSGGGMWDTEDLKTKAASCISADGKIQIDGGTMKLTSTGSGGKGMNCDGELIMNDGEVTISTSGGTFAYVNGTEYPNYTGNTDNLNSDYKSSAKGIKADGNVTINGGTIKVLTTGRGSEGIESKAVMTINGGTLVVHAYDDGINASSHIYIKGGDLTIVSTKNDGIDANGSIYVSGGVTRTFGASSPECGLDANTEQGYTVYFTGGTLLAAGGSNSVPSTSESTQPYVSGSGSITAGTTVTLSDGATQLASFTVPADYGTTGTTMFAGRPGGPGGPGGSSGGGIVITCAGMTSGNSYTLTCGSTSTTVTATLRGSSWGRP